MNKHLRRRLFAPASISVVYLAVGVVAFGLIADGFVQTWQAARRPAPPPVAAVDDSDDAPPPVDERYVPPADIEYPFF